MNIPGKGMAESENTMESKKLEALMMAVDLGSFTRAAEVFAAIAAVEKTHAARFDRCLRLLQDDALFTGGRDTAWLCLNCGHIHTGSEAPVLCPVCRHDQGHFIRTDLTPFALP